MASYALQAFFLLVALLAVGGLAEEKKVRVVTMEELAKNNGQDGADIWLAIFGEVYDVTNGREYYGTPTGYGIFAGRHGNVPFVTGVFTEEEAAKPLDALSPVQIKQLYEWRAFYEKEDKYPFVGLLEGELYDKDGNPTPRMIKARAEIEEATKEQERLAKEREEKFKKARGEL